MPGAFSVEVLAAYSYSAQPLTCSVATPWRLTNPVRASETEREESWSLRDRADERDIAASLAAARAASGHSVRDVAGRFAPDPGMAGRSAA